VEPRQEAWQCRGMTAGRDRDWDLRADELSAAAIAEGRPTTWFDELYAEGVAGSVGMPWDRSDPQAELAAWWQQHGTDLARGRAVVVGCGLGADAEFLAREGFATTAFDVAPTAIEEARRRHPGSPVDYRVESLLDLPADLVGAFGLVVEIFTLQALPDPPRTQAAAAVASLLAPGGTLLLVAFRAEDGGATHGPPFALTRDDLAAAAGDGVELRTTEELPGPRWRAEYRRS
jgi:SAM-dependent methyltransferase